MSDDKRISEEQLSAFTDGELETEEAGRILSEAESCPELDARLCQQRKLKEMVQHAYRDLPQPQRPGTPSPLGRRNLLTLATAAVLVLAVGLVAGWFVHRAAEEPRMTDAAPAAAVDSWLLHVATSDPERMARALDRAEALMAGAEPGAPRHVEIVANESGLNLLRSDVTPFADRIRRLADEDVLFFACARAIERLEEQGVDVQLVPQAETRYTALDRVVDRMSQGWTYEKI